MTQMTVTFEWDDDLGPRWMNRDNLAILLYTSEATKGDLLSIESVDFVDATPMERVKAEALSLNNKLKNLYAFTSSSEFNYLERVERGCLND